ncbi:MarR family winged helix-turn-helix transcriptional regulator [Paenibacillus sp. J22TS3]|uniref:MarR family winged helix-turn-helix transcriptional regulator n=1 Tax=Paenibacillus sp. J22TS3 TaxID=2807192 RepID=UPI001B26BE20|nr:MarR family transcriptional regulator [Paenibacillus sp. J22TS3]GIP21353.1 MarR family transcriptional regulator [Paenibacillus sp. J22TS3]
MQQPKQLIDRYVTALSSVTKRLNYEITKVVQDDMTVDQYQIMYYINAQERCTSTVLADAFCVGKSSITAIITRLVDRGLIERTRDEDDRRLIYLSLTDRGREVYDKADRKVQDMVSSYLTHFNQDEVESFIGTFEKLARLVGEGSKE